LFRAQDFHNIAYKAMERRDLLSAINEFLDCSIVLPPGDWERKALLPFRELKAKNEAIRRRQSRTQDAAEAQKCKYRTFLLLVFRGFKMKVHLFRGFK
jgi:Band 3 cytoplasmic domain.